MNSDRGVSFITSLTKALPDLLRTIDQVEPPAPTEPPQDPHPATGPGDAGVKSMNSQDESGLGSTLAT